MSAARVRVTARGAARCEHVFADHRVDAETARWAARIDAEFLAEVGWDPSTLVLVLPPEHPLLGRPVCRVAGCATTAATRERVCFSCRRRLADRGLDIADLDQLRALVPASAEPVDEDEACLVVACGRTRRHAGGTYCDAHQQRLRAARSVDPGLDERRWRRTAAPVSGSGEVNMRGLAPMVIAQVLLGLQQRCNLTGVKTKETDLRVFCNELRELQASTLADYGDRGNDRAGTFAAMVNAIALGLTRPGAPAAGLGEDCSLHRDDVPAEPEPGEPGRDLPTEIMRQICSHLPRIASAEMRTGIELAIDTGRRPEEICDLPYDCLTRDDDGSPALVYNNRKANRLDRRLSISEATATLVISQQQRVRAATPTHLSAS